MNGNPAEQRDLAPSDEVVLKVENLSKVFKLYPTQSGRLKEWLSLGRRSYHREFWALRDVSFQVKRGEFLGIIGPNGAGKSTLLRLITGVLDSTGGKYRIEGKVLSLLELSGGMDNDLTGRENVIRSAQLLGFPDNYVKERMQQIADFAELGDFFDAPLSTYSSGMRIRLGFSMFAFMDCDILILDEVLAVGDIFFKQKCFARLEQLMKKNTAIVLVTHSTGTVMRYCDNVLVLENGRIIFEGQPDKAIQRYFQIRNKSTNRLQAVDTYIEEDPLTVGAVKQPAAAPDGQWPDDSIFLGSPLPDKIKSNGATLIQLAVCDHKEQPRLVFRQGEKAFIYYTYEVQQNMGVPVAELSLNTVQNLLVHSRNSLQYETHPPLRLHQGELLRVTQELKLDMAPGKYIFNLDLFSLHADHYNNLAIFSARELLDNLVNVCKVKPAGVIEVVEKDQNPRRIRAGMFELDGDLQLQVCSRSSENSLPLPGPIAGEP